MVFSFLARRRRRRAMKDELPTRVLRILEEQCDFYKDIKERERFLNHLKIFLDSKEFVGCKGQVIDDEVRVVIAASAARMARNLPYDVYERLSEIVVYPSTFYNPNDEKQSARLGEAHSWGVVVLSWDAVKKGIQVANDGHDTAIHEFAHSLDFEDGVFDGTPILHKGADYHAWVAAFSESYARLRKTKGQSVMREYGLTSEVEFFAVATEVFFEKPRKLRRKEPKLYASLSNFYGLDPAQKG